MDKVLPNIGAIFEAADEIEAQDPNIARIMWEQAYILVQTLDTSNEGLTVLQFTTAFNGDFKPVLLEKGWSTIDRSNDIDYLWEFYQLYKQKNLVEDIQPQEEKWRQTGALCSNVKQLTDMRKVFATLRALIVAMEYLSTRDAPGTRISILVMEELRRTNWMQEVTPTDNPPLDVASSTKSIGVFLEAMDKVPSCATNIGAIFEAADEIEAQDPNVARIMWEQAYLMVQTLDTSSEGLAVLQFTTAFNGDFKPALLGKGWSTIDRSNDIEYLWEFYQLYKQKNLVEDIQLEEEKWRQTGVFCSNVKQLTDMRKVFATLRALIVAMEYLSTRASPGTRISILVMDELRRTKWMREVTPTDIPPLDVASSTNAIGVFLEGMDRVPSCATNIGAIFEAADEIEAQDPNVARIMWEQAYLMVQTLDTSSEGLAVLQFTTAFNDDFKPALLGKGWSTIDRSNDIEYLWEFYQLYKQKNLVEDIQPKEEKWRKTGVLCSNAKQLTDMRKVFATLRALIVAMEYLSTRASPGTRISILVMDELRRTKWMREVTPTDIPPLDVASSTNAIGVFLEGMDNAPPWPTNIGDIFEAVDNIEAQDPNVARIMWEQAYLMVQTLDTSSEGLSALQFTTAFNSDFKPALLGKGWSTIDRSNDIEILWEFYQLYKQKHRIEDIQRDEAKWRKTRLTDLREVFATIRALIVAMEYLSVRASPGTRISILVMDEIRRIKLTQEITPTDIPPLNAPSSTNPIGVFIEGMDNAPSWATNIGAIFEAADEFEAQDPNVARIMWEQAYQMVQTLNINSEGLTVLQFTTAFNSDFKPSLLGKGWSTIDRSNDIEHLWEFYQLYKRKHRVEDIQRERKSGGIMGLAYTKEVFSTLRALVEAMEYLSTSTAPGTRISIMAMDELRWINWTREVTPTDIPPLDAPSSTNAIGVFQEVIPAIQDFNDLTPQTATVLPSAPPLPYDVWPIYYPSIDMTPVEVSMQNEAPKPIELEDKDENLCVVCWDSPVEGACVPCGHMAGCMSCLNQIKSEERDCPVCRAKINQVIRIYAV